MFKFKSCPKCSGDLYIGETKRDRGEAYCLQCGYREYGPSMALVAVQWVIWNMENPQVRRAA